MSRHVNRAVKRNRSTSALVAAACLSLPVVAFAAPASWTGNDYAGTGNDDWSDANNWSGYVSGSTANIPGTTGTTTNTDVATFPSVTTTGTVTLDASYNIDGIDFTGGGYIINNANGSSLLLTSGSTILGIPATGTAAAQIINAPIVVEQGTGATGAATFNTGALAGDALTLNGTLSGASTSGATTITLNGAGSGIASGIISDANTSGGGVTNIVVGGNGGNWTLSGANTYTGTSTIGVSTTATAVTLNVSSINTVGTATYGSQTSTHLASSSMGAPTTVANGTISFTKNCILNYTGTGETTDRVVSLSGATTGGQINQSGTGTLAFISNMSSTTSSGTKTFALGGNGAGAGVFAGVISDDTTTKAATVFQTGLTKTGSTNWTVSGANTFTGPVNVGGTGQLILGSSSAAGSGPLGTTFSIINLATTSGMTSATYTKTNANTQAPNIVAGDTIVDAGVLPADTYVVSDTVSSGTYTITFSAPASTTGSSTLTVASPIQMAASTESLNLNGQTLSGQHIYMQNGATLTNSSATTAIINGDIADQSGAAPDTTDADTYVVGGGTGNMSIAGINGGTANHTGTGTLTITPAVGTTNVVTLQATAGVVQMGEANALTNTSNLILNGGTYGTGGANQALASLTVNNTNGTIDFGAGNTGSVLNFASLASFNGTDLTINDWTGIAGQGGGTDQLLFASNANLAAALPYIDFTGYAPGAQTVMTNGEYEVVPAVPEPASLSLAALSLAALCVRRRRGTIIKV